MHHEEPSRDPSGIDPLGMLEFVRKADVLKQLDYQDGALGQAGRSDPSRREREEIVEFAAKGGCGQWGRVCKEGDGRVDRLLQVGTGVPRALTIVWQLEP